MQMFRALEQDEVASVGWGVHVALAAAPGADSQTMRKLRRLMSHVEPFDQMYDVVAALIDDPSAFDIAVIECDDFGGIELCRRACAMLREAQVKVPVILLSHDVEEQLFPSSWHEPIVLRAPLTSVALRVALEQAFQGRLVAT